MYGARIEVWDDVFHRETSYFKGMITEAKLKKDIERANREELGKITERVGDDIAKKLNNHFGGNSVRFLLRWKHYVGQASALPLNIEVWAAYEQEQYTKKCYLDKPKLDTGWRIPVTYAITIQLGEPAIKTLKYHRSHPDWERIGIKVREKLGYDLFTTGGRSYLDGIRMSAVATVEGFESMLPEKIEDFMFQTNLNKYALALETGLAVRMN